MTPTPPPLWLIIIVGAALGASLVATFLTRTIARRVGFVAKPRAERWHSKPTALAGGAGIFLAFAGASLVVGGPIRLPLLAGAGAMFALGFVDDVVHLKPYAKLVAQLVIAALTVLSGPVLPWTSIPLVDQAISLFWIVGITNAINLLDNMDGLAGGVACIGASFQAIFFLLQHQYPQAGVSAALAGALLGFLVFNWSPASIFMGDCGALFLGYTLAALAMQSSYGRSRGLLLTIAAPVLVMLVPIFDTTFVTLVRVVRGRPVSLGGRDHTSHRLVTLGLSERTAVGLLLTVGALGGTIGVLARLGVWAGVWVGAPLLAMTLAFLGIHLARTDRPAEERDRVNLLSAFAAFGYRRRIFEVVLDATNAMIAMIGAFLLRFDGDIPGYIQDALGRIFLVSVVAQVGALYLVRAYDGLWRYVDGRDMSRLCWGAALGSGFVFIIAGVWLRFQAVSRGALVIDGVLFAALTCGSRVSFRVLRTILEGRSSAAKQAGTRLLLWGAGDLGAGLARRLQEDTDGGLVPVGFVDDDPLKSGRVVHGLLVHGDSGAIAGLIAEGVATLVVVTSPRISADRIAMVSERVGAGRVRRLRLLLEEVRLGGAAVPASVDTSAEGI